MYTPGPSDQFRSTPGWLREPLKKSEIGAKSDTVRFVTKLMSAGSIFMVNLDSGAPPGLLSKPMSLMKGTDAVILGPPRTNWVKVDQHSY